MQSRFFFLYLPFFCLVSCRTSQELARGQDARFVDPTGVKTVEDSATAAPLVSSSPEIDVLKGRIEDLEMQKKAETEQLIARIAELETQVQLLSAENGRLKGPETPSPGTTTQASDPAGTMWLAVQNELAANNVKGAKDQLVKLLREHPKSKYTAPALARLGTLQYNHKSFEDAALTFNKIIEQFPKEPSTSFAWFGQAASFSMLKQNAEANLVFEELQRRYPKSEETKLSRSILTKKSRVPPELDNLLAKHPRLLKP